MLLRGAALFSTAVEDYRCGGLQETVLPSMVGQVSPWAKRFRGVIRPESFHHVFLLPKTLNLKKKSGGHLSVVAFGSERPLTENIYTF